MSIDTDQVRRVALLARLDLPAEEVDRYAEELSRVLEYVEQLERLGLEDRPALTDLSDQHRPPRADREGGDTLTREQALSQAPATDGTYFLVPPVVEYPE
jgi:aspartyl-tRNA(Asn)/glutamyl-tRNA(Gln) amidotransferase subunit C